MATMADVAKQAGVALSTVSYALSGTRPVSDETKERVFKAIDELGYRPNIMARSLAAKRTRIIALLFPTLEGLSRTQLEFVSSAVNIASQRGYALLLWPSASKDEEVVHLAQEGLVEGLVLMQVRREDARVAMLRELGYPFTLIGHCQDNEEISYVDYDFEQALRLSVGHLADLGHRHMAFLNYRPIGLNNGFGPELRSERGFWAEVEARGVVGTARACEPTPQQAYEMVRELLAERPSLTSLIVVDEPAYLGVFRALNEEGLAVPRDFSLVAITSTRIAEGMSPPLTGPDIPTGEMGRIGTELLMDQLEGKLQEPSQLLLPAVLRLRESTLPCRDRQPEE
ncbi:LacI family DNA-binding transcriptional regulator [Chloroflexota bacterium]